MKKQNLLFLLTITLILGSCGASSNFNKRKYTNLGKIKTQYKDQNDVVIELNEDETASFEVSPQFIRSEDQEELQEELLSSADRDKSTENYEIEGVEGLDEIDEVEKTDGVQQLPLKEESANEIVEEERNRINQKKRKWDWELFFVVLIVCIILIPVLIGAIYLTVLSIQFIGAYFAGTIVQGAGGLANLGILLAFAWLIAVVVGIPLWIWDAVR